MRYLTVVRHGKAQPLKEGETDLDRRLEAKGRRDARRAGLAVSRIAPAADLLVSSPARRARETGAILRELVQARRSGTLHDYLEPRAYGADGDLLLQILRQLPDTAQHAVLVGHNPGLETLVAGLLSGSPRRQAVTLSPATVAHLQLDIPLWNQCRWGCGQIQLLAAPRYLRK